MSGVRVVRRRARFGQPSASAVPAMVPVPGSASCASWRDANGISSAAPKITTMTAITIRLASEMSMNDQLTYVPG